MWILGISLSHNGGVTLIKDGKVICAVQAERISRVKRQDIKLEADQELVAGCVNYVLTAAGIDSTAIDAIAITSPWKVRHYSLNELEAYIGGRLKADVKVEYVPHHLSHAEYALHYRKESQVPCLVLVIDGSGSFEQDSTMHTIPEEVHGEFSGTRHEEGKEVISCYLYDGKSVQLIYKHSPTNDPSNEINMNSKGLIQSLGHYWRWGSWYCCGSHNDAGKIMGLAAFANEDDINASYANWSIENGVEIDFKRLYEDFKEPNFSGKDISGDDRYIRVAGILQNDTDTIILKMLKELSDRFSAKDLCYAGGVALNVVTNEKIFRSRMFDNITLNGSCEDNGTSAGAALAVNAQYSGARESEDITDYYGRTYDDDEINEAVTQSGNKFKKLDPDELTSHAARELADGNVIGWFQGRSEFGPRALGNRSILANPASKYTKALLDVRMKQRDRYRPYAPAVLREDVGTYFDITGDSPVMMREAQVLSDDYPAITHADKSARVQTVSVDDNPIFHELIGQFKELTGVSMLLNTSFNQAGEPIVESPQDALVSFGNSFLDSMYIGNYYVYR